MSELNPLNDKLYFPGLNGIRGVAVFTVVFQHVLIQLHLKPFIYVASHNLTMFFVLSGFLITYLLLSEKEKTNTIDLKKYYIRRILRIWPLYYAYLIIILILLFYFKTLTFSSPELKILWYYVFFSANIPLILQTTIPYLSHFWSLGVEEQFYIWWPIFMKKVKKPIGFIIAIIVILLGLKIIFHAIQPYGLGERIIHVTRFHTILFGSVAAFLLYYKHKLVNILTHPIVQAFAWLIVVLIGMGKLYFWGLGFLRTELFGLAFVSIILAQATNKGVPFFNNPILDYLGKISYGIYLIHMMVIFILIQIHPYTSWNPIVFLILTSVASTILAGLSFNYLEKPFLTLKEKFTIIKSKSSL